MTFTRDYLETVNNRVKQDPELAKALLDEATSLFLNGEPETARLILRDLVNSTIGFEELAIQTSNHHIQIATEKDSDGSGNSLIS